MNSIRMLVYGFLDANKGLRSVFRGDKHFKKFLNSKILLNHFTDA